MYSNIDNRTDRTFIAIPAKDRNLYMYSYKNQELSIPYTQPLCSLLRHLPPQILIGIVSIPSTPPVLSVSVVLSWNDCLPCFRLCFAVSLHQLQLHTVSFLTGDHSSCPSLVGSPMGPPGARPCPGQSVGSIPSLSRVDRDMSMGPLSFLHTTTVCVCHSTPGLDWRVLQCLFRRSLQMHPAHP